MEFHIPEQNLEKLRKSITRIRRKAEKYGCTVRYEETGEEYRQVRDRSASPAPGLPGPARTVRFVTVEAEGTAVIAGWEFIAGIDHLPAGNIIRTASDVDVPEKYFTAPGICEHCGTSRARKHTCIVRNVETGEYRQVGRQCLKDYTGGLSAETAAALAELQKTLRMAEEEPEDGFFSGPVYCGTRDMLLYAAETVRCFGYVKTDSRDAEPTKYRAARYWGLDRGLPVSRAEEAREDMESAGFRADRPENRELADGALEWLRTCPEDSSYIHNLKVIAGMQYVTERELGYLVSIIPTWNRQRRKMEEQKAREETRRAGGWAGEEGKRITFRIADAQLVTSWETCWGYRTQTTYLYKIWDEQGNVFTWKTSAGLVNGGDAGKLLTGTVKAHEEYRGEKQTALTRCRIAA